MSANEPPSFNSPAGTPHIQPFEADRYIGYVNDFEMTDAQKVEFLRTLWDIMATFVRLGFGVESVLPSLFQRASVNAGDELEQTIPTHEFNVAAEIGATKEEE